jgi:hypothetical protein
MNVKLMDKALGCKLLGPGRVNFYNSVTCKTLLSLNLTQPWVRIGNSKQRMAAIMRNMEAQTFVQVMKRLYEITFQNSVSGY